MVVVDASVAYKWFNLEEPNYQSAISILNDHQQEIAEIIAPDLIITELSNAWATKTALSLARIKANLSQLEELKLTFVPVTFSLAQKAVAFSRKYKVSVYDSIYAVLAKEKDCNLYSADEKFVNHLNLPFIKSLNNI